MIKHIVMWNVQGETEEERNKAAQFVKNRFESLIGLIPGMHKMEVGQDVSGVDYACHVVLYTEFESQEALDAYASHPEHLRVRDEIGGIRISRHQVDFIPKEVQI